MRLFVGQYYSRLGKLLLLYVVLVVVVVVVVAAAAAAAAFALLGCYASHPRRGKVSVTSQRMPKVRVMLTTPGLSAFVCKTSFGAS
jgi:hypothetical protein